MQRRQQMLYDIVMSDASIVVSEECAEMSESEEQRLVIRVMAENNSYLPLGDRCVLLYAADEVHLEDASHWTRVRTESGKLENELEYAYPMQRVWTKEAFRLSVRRDHTTYLIAQINDCRGSLSNLPEGGIKGITRPELFRVVSC